MVILAVALTPGTEELGLVLRYGGSAAGWDGRGQRVVRRGAVRLRMGITRSV